MEVIRTMNKNNNDKKKPDIDIDIDIETNIENFKKNNPLVNYKESSFNTRFKSWEWCRCAFLEGENKYHSDEVDENTKESIIDNLALHLGFYLASWGMYRGSCFILQRDYKVHKMAVKCILESKYKPLWIFDPIKASEKEINDIYKLIFDKNEGIYFKIKNSYKTINEENIDEKFPTSTLITKILLGTFACLPAFDDFLVNAIRYCKKKDKENGKYKNLKTNIENYSENDFAELCKFAAEHKDELKIEYSINDKDIVYPMMRCIDAYFWEIGLNLDRYKKRLKDENEKNK